MMDNNWKNIFCKMDLSAHNHRNILHLRYKNRSNLLVHLRRHIHLFHHIGGFDNQNL